MLLANVETRQDLQEDYKRCQNKTGTKKLPALQNFVSYLCEQSTFLFSPPPPDRKCVIGNFVWLQAQTFKMEMVAGTHIAEENIQRN